MQAVDKSIPVSDVSFIWNSPCSEERITTISLCLNLTTLETAADSDVLGLIGAPLHLTFS
jgi:hypothetical protein